MKEIIEPFSVFIYNPLIDQALRKRRLSWQLITALILAVMAYCPAGMLLFTWASAALLAKSDLLFNNIDSLGQAIFYPTAILLLILVTLFAPVLAVGAIAGERQRQTLPLLLITLLPIRALIWGKLITALITLFILIGIVWPLILLSSVLGAISPFELMVITLLLLMTAIAFTNIGLFVSSRSKSIINATMLTYGVAVPGFLIGPFLVMLLVTLLSLISAANDKLLAFGWSMAASLNPLTAAVYSYSLWQEKGGTFLVELPPLGYIIYPWVIYIVFYGFLSLVLFEATAQHVEKTDEM